MSSNIQKTRAYFEKNPKHFKNAVEEYPVMYQEAAERINRLLRGNVLDIGSGGVLNYNTKKAENIFLADITTANKERAREHLFFINADMRCLGIKEEAMEIVIMQHLLHHLADNTVKKSLNNVSKGFKEALRISKKRGKLIIVEGLVPYPLDLLQRALFQMNKRLYKWLFHFPMVLQYSERTIKRKLQEAGFIIESTETIEDGDILPIFGMNIPRKFVPLKHKFIVAVKE